MLMPIVLLLTVLYLLLYRTKYFKTKIKRKNPKFYFKLHVVLVSLSGILVLLHAVSKIPYFSYIPLWMNLSGIALLLLLVLQFYTGIRVKQKPNAKLMKLHRQIPVVFFVVLAAHAVILKAIAF